MLWTQPGTVTQRDDGGYGLAGEISGPTWNEKFVAGSAKFEAMDLPTKLERLQALDVVLPELTEEIRSLIAARNRLVHRAGIVAPRDVRSNDEMFIGWWKLAMSAEKNGKSTVVDFGSSLEAGAILRVEIRKAGLTFALGQRIVLTTDDFEAIVMTYTYFGQQLGVEILNMQRRRFENES